ncbi:DnaD domain protein [[Mycoplasma] collis]|uniref:DnaD domain protein n=1 Tax=[Mycoplasma] collis TaxID=2127 RepID=UPI000B151FEC|nr:DnaD domain protein [[Mycoplasma] collis]
MEKFNVKVSKKISEFDLEIINDFYLPIIGATSFVVYLNLYNQFKKNNFKIFELNLKTFLKKLKISEQEWIETRSTLEAVSLFQTYFDQENNEFYIVLQKPSEYSSFLKNSLLNSQIKEKISQDEFKKLLSKYDEVNIIKKNFKNISKKFYEIFNCNFKKEDYILENKNENNFIISETKVTNNSKKEVLNTSNFLKTLTNKDAKPSLVKAVDTFLDKLSQDSINEILKFCYLSDGNNHISISYFKKIAQDLINKNVILANEIKIELSETLIYKQRKNKNQNQINVLESVNDKFSNVFNNSQPKKRRVLDETFSGVINED